MKLTDDILSQIGIKNPLHRMQLINTRDDLLAQQDHDAAVSPTRQLASTDGSSHRTDAGSPLHESPSKPSSPTPSFMAPQQSMKVWRASRLCVRLHEVHTCNACTVCKLSERALRRWTA